VRGARFNFLKRLAEAPAADVFLAVAARVARLGWQVDVYFESCDLAELAPLLAQVPAPVVIDHMGRPDVGLGIDGDDFRRLMALLEEHPSFWIKVSCPDRLSRVWPGYDDVVPFGRALVTAFPQRVLWGTDWPHPNVRTHMPDDGALVDFIPRIAPGVGERRALLVENPMRLYWSELPVAAVSVPLKRS
jgi:2-pyrone-4,6-dicarboxylate lactonase